MVGSWNISSGVSGHSGRQDKVMFHCSKISPSVSKA